MIQNIEKTGIKCLLTGSGLGLLTILGTTMGCGGKAPEATEQPNIVFVFADQWRAQSTGYASNSDVITPTLDRLAEESVNFTTAVANMPVCSPYRANLLTGQYPLTHGLFMNDAKFNPEANTMGKIFKAAGYNTAYIGKWHLDGHGRSAYIPPERRQGFDYWKVLECTHTYNKSLYYANQDTTSSVWPGYDAHYQTLDAMNYIQNNAQDEKPFLLVLSWGPPHAPYHTAPEEYREKYKDREIQLRPNVPDKFHDKAQKDIKGYYAHINALDDYLNKLLKTIEKEGIEENTIFVFTSDHGDMLYSHEQIKKQQPYDESIRVPFLLKYPGLKEKSKNVIDVPVNTQDILPTLLGLSGIEIPQTVEGKDFTQIIKGNEQLDDNAALIACITPFGQWPRARGGVEYRGIRTKRYTYAKTLDGPWLLFDNKTDPYQLNNLIGNPEYETLQQELDKMLIRKLEETNDEFLSGKDYIEMWGYEVDETGTIPFEW
ncbi:MAG: sulfatase [Prolixibacteraceae bacterium]|nr:sulfatase [Prolixibacteraceae bacterium]